jgi:arylsulfatase
VESLDILPTILDILGIDPPEDIRGRSLLPLILDKKTRNRSKIFAGTMGKRLKKTTLKTVRTEKWQLILHELSREIELFDLMNDPEEQRNLCFEKKEIAHALLQDLDQWIESLDHRPESVRTIQPDEEMTKNLRDLGYVE